MELTEDQMDDKICEAQDAFFEGKYEKAFEVCYQLIQTKAGNIDYDVNEIICSSLAKLHRWKECIAQTKQWGQVVGEGPNQLRILLEACYFAQLPEEVLDVSYTISDYLEDGHEALYHDYVSSVAMVADLGKEDSENLKFLKGLPTPESDEGKSRVAVMIAWAQLHSDARDEGLKALQNLIAKKYKLALAMLLLDHLDHNNIEVAKKIIADEKKKGDITWDMSLSLVEALISTPQETQKMKAFAKYPIVHNMIKLRVYKLLNPEQYKSESENEKSIQEKESEKISDKQPDK